MSQGMIYLMEGGIFTRQARDAMDGFMVWALSEDLARAI